MLSTLVYTCISLFFEEYDSSIEERNQEIFYSTDMFMEQYITSLNRLIKSLIGSFMARQKKFMEWLTRSTDQIMISYLFIRQMLGRNNAAFIMIKLFSFEQT